MAQILFVYLLPTHAAQQLVPDVPICCNPRAFVPRHAAMDILLPVFWYLFVVEMDRLFSDKSRMVLRVISLSH